MSDCYSFARARIAEIGRLSRPLSDRSAGAYARTVAQLASAAIEAGGDTAPIFEIYERRIRDEIERVERARKDGLATHVKPLAEVLARFSKAECANA